MIFRHLSVFETTAMLNLSIYSIFLWLPLPDLKESLVRLLLIESSYRPSSAFLMNISIALKGPKLFIIIGYHCSCCSAVWRPKKAPTLIFSADYILKAKSSFTLFSSEYINTRSTFKQMKHCH